MLENSLNDLVKNLAKQEIKTGNLNELVNKTGLSKHWFYEVSKGGIKDPRCSAVVKFLSAINHPLSKQITAHCEQDAA